MFDSNRIFKFAEEFGKSIEEKSISELENQLIEAKEEYWQLDNERSIEEKPRLRDVLQNKIMKKPIVAKLPDQHKISRINQLSIMISKLEGQIALLKSR